MSASHDTFVDFNPIIGQLGCPKCKNVVECRQSDAVEFATHHSWPVCCNEIMVFLSDSEAEQQPIGMTPTETQFPQPIFAG